MPLAHIFGLKDLGRKIVQALTIGAFLCSGAPAKAASLDVFGSTILINANSCTVQDPPQFRVVNYTIVGQTNDGGGNDYVAYYAVDGGGTILASHMAQVVVGDRADPRPNMLVPPTQIAGDLTFHLVDEADGVLDQAVGATFNAVNILASNATYANVFLNAVCGNANANANAGGGGGGGGGAGGGGGGNVATQIVSTQVSQTQNDLRQNNLQRHVSQLTGGSGGGSDSVSTGDITTNTIDEDEKIQERAKEYARQLAKELAAEFNGDDALNAYFSKAQLGATGHFPLLRPSQNEATDRDALRALASRIGFSTANLGQAASAAAFDGDIGPVEPSVGVDVATALPERRDINFFVYGSYSNVDNDRNVGGDDRRFSGDAIALTAGVDKRIDQGVSLGLGLTVTTTDLETQFNSGDYKDWTFALAPYLVLEPNDWMVITASAGYAYSSIDLTRNSGAVTADTDAHAAFASLNIEARAVEMEKLRIVGSLDIDSSYKVTSRYTESDGTLVAAQRDVTLALEPEIEVAWREPLDVDFAIEPFANLGVLWDLGDVTNQDNEAFELGGGVRLVAPDLGLTAELGGSAEIGRDDYEELTAYGSISYGYSPSGDDALATSLSLNGDEENTGLNLSVSYAPGDILPDSKVSLSLDNSVQQFAEVGPSVQISFSASF